MAISKKLRFEVFKRDGFACAYCGKTPPAVTLEVDHIDPKSKGGKDDINNLITACFDCNRGKKNIPLSKIPTTLSENLDVLREKEEQIKEYRKFVKQIDLRIKKDIDQVEKTFQVSFPDKVFTETFRQSTVKRFVQALPVHEVSDSMSLACNKKDNADDCIKYFCGICWNKIKADDPEKKIVRLWIQLGFRYFGKQVRFYKEDLYWLSKIDLEKIADAMNEAFASHSGNYWNVFTAIVQGK